MSEMQEASVDAVVCDPPYGLEFMGKEWDKLWNQKGEQGQQGRINGQGGMDTWGKRPTYATGKIAQDWHQAWATEALRVLKPGGHLLAFGGTRTYHRLACAIEDAGFEIRDCLAWLYGSGFPKSLDVSKAIDKRGGANIGWFGPWLREERHRRGISSNKLSEHFPSKTGNNTGCVRNWELGNNLPTVEQFNKLCEVLALPFRHIEEAEREVVGKQFNVANKNNDNTGRYNWNTENQKRVESIDLTAPATPEAQQWNGWGTALKPAHEPIVLARKPLVGTVAQNCLEHGTGALNIDGTRVGQNGNGRWPANLVLDEHAARLLDEQSGESKSTGGKGAASQRTALNGDVYGDYAGTKLGQNAGGLGDSGGASRFFYVAKASRRERNAGLEGFEERDKGFRGTLATTGYNPKTGERTGLNRQTAQNHHPTVKPTALMRWLCRLVTPPGGLVLDPFAGSGTTGIAATLEGFDFIGIEREAEYVAIARARIEHWASEEKQLELS